jgi:hypothetical protein
LTVLDERHPWHDYSSADVAHLIDTADWRKLSDRGYAEISGRYPDDPEQRRLLTAEDGYQAALAASVRSLQRYEKKGRARE